MTRRDNPALAAARRKGSDARLAGEPSSKNPYLGKAYFLAWLWGWKDADTGRDAQATGEEG